jgi:hypothetical protein
MPTCTAHTCGIEDNFMWTNIVKKYSIRPTVTIIFDQQRYGIVLYAQICHSREDIYISFLVEIIPHLCFPPQQI